MDKHMKEHQKKGLKCILMLLMSPIAFFFLIFKALLSVLQFLFKATLLFSIVTINTPFAVMINLSILVENLLRDSSFDPRVTVGIEFKTIVSNFFKVIAAEFLLIMSTGVITFYTAPRQVFYISMAGGVTAIALKWLNTDSSSKTAFSCLCGGFGLNPMMFFFSYLGLFDIGCHPIAKCSFPAHKAFLFTKEAMNLCNGGNGWKPFIKSNIVLENASKVSSKPIEFSKWNAFERGLFQLYPRIDFDIGQRKEKKKCILKSYMVLKLLEMNLCEYHVERLELPEDYSKVYELYNFLDDLYWQDGFVTDKMRGRYEHSLTLLEIVDGVQQSVGYKIMDPIDEWFVVAGCTNLQH